MHAYFTHIFQGCVTGLGPGNIDLDLWRHMTSLGPNDFEPFEHDINIFLQTYGDCETKILETITIPFHVSLLWLVFNDSYMSNSYFFKKHA